MSNEGMGTEMESEFVEGEMENGMGMGNGNEMSSSGDNGNENGDEDADGNGSEEQHSRYNKCRGYNCRRKRWRYRGRVKRMKREDVNRRGYVYGYNNYGKGYTRQNGNNEGDSNGNNGN